YKVEERVHRPYDSSEPPYYVDTRSGGAKFETKPLLDLTFDELGIPIRNATQPPFTIPLRDRSPTQTEFTEKTCGFASDPQHSIAGVSGHGLSIPPDSECIGTVAPGKAPNLSDFTAELWIRPHCSCCPERIVLSSGQIFSIAVAQDGRLQCKIGTGSVKSIDPLPTDVWTHVALTYDSGNVRCVINGVPQGSPISVSISGSTTLSAISLGEHPPSIGQPV